MYICVYNIYHLHTFVYTWIHIYIYTSVYIWIYLYMNMYIYICIGTSMRGCLSNHEWQRLLRIYSGMYIYTYIYLYIYIYKLSISRYFRFNLYVYICMYLHIIIYITGIRALCHSSCLRCRLISFFVFITYALLDEIMFFT
jgi:hypothetical protein